MSLLVAQSSREIENAEMGCGFFYFGPALPTLQRCEGVKSGNGKVCCREFENIRE